MIEVSANFDGGNILVNEIQENERLVKFSLKIRADEPEGQFKQWFYFRVSGVKGKTCRWIIENAAECFSPEGWTDYQACASYDRINWFRVSTSFDGERLMIDHKPDFDNIVFAYFAPFSYEQHLSMVMKAQQTPSCNHSYVGKTVEGRHMDLLTIGENSVFKKKIWIIARQHPGESMASWFMKGFLERITDSSDPASIKLLKKAVFYLVPYMNIDGGMNGNLRTNKAGQDLNRAWKEPSEERSPEVYYVRQMMEQTGVDLSLDIHGDEELPYCFASRIDGIPSFNETLANIQKLFTESWATVNPDFQNKHGYPVDKPGAANLAIGSKYIANFFKCLSLTIEMPFKDNADLPDPVYGWSPRRSEKLGASLINALLMVVDDLKRAL